MTRGEPTYTVEHRHLATLPSGREIETPIHRYEAIAPGPTVYVQALQHGGEVNGAVVLRRLHRRLVKSNLSGTVLAVPVANPLAVDHRRYTISSRVDAVNTNMNRHWPGDSDGTVLQRIVARLWDVAGESDVVVDIHTGGPEMLSHVRYTPGDDRSRELAESFGLDYVVAEGTAKSSPESGNASGKLREIASGNGIPCITPELSHSRAIVEESVESGVTGVENVLKAVGVLDGEPDAGAPGVASEMEPVTADKSGLFTPAVSVGDRVRVNQSVGTVEDPGLWETRDTVRTPVGGLVLSISPGASVVEGERVANVVDLV
ncbi:MAG: succinylglutamate desuccinylase/aspartoacylase family protein [Halodesulfurarchaeum sp.]